jgi:hypothetical protein
MRQSILATMARSSSVKSGRDRHSSFLLLATKGEKATALKATLRNFFLTSGLAHENALLPIFIKVGIICLIDRLNGKTL